ncbi:methyl-CpG-binding domain protein 4-like protein isoform X3 [Agrilus planipennis]|uniref:Methyl-CpG-binding domain protein 4-like protein isoform X3 n=1 Tax=Agrilus planipennis TaxID=224129 RepID=A0A1W4XLK9_AGRPL|nr:methyl-CpG-binding domain protein 4-like protein isoform X3 [Agrilus planipennis]
MEKQRKCASLSEIIRHQPQENGEYGKPRLIKLSKYFNENAQLVAGVCPKCYAECSEVKITAVNRKFLKITNQHRLLENVLAKFTKEAGYSKRDSAPFNENPKGGYKIDLLDSFEKNNKRKSSFGGAGKEIEVKHSYPISVILNQENCEDDLKVKQAKLLKQKDFHDGLDHNVDSSTKIGTSKYFLRNYNGKLDTIKDMEEVVSVSNRQKLIKFHNIRTGKQPSEATSKDSVAMSKRSTYFFLKHNVDKMQTKPLKHKATTYNEIVTSSDSPLLLNKEETSIVVKSSSKLSVKDQDIRLSQYVSRALTDEEIMIPASCSFCQEKLLQKSPQSSTTSLDSYDVRHEENCKSYEPKKMLWMPPKSPHNLIEESLSHDPWALLVATIFLNKTSCMVARQYVEEFLQDNPNPQTVLKKDSSELVKYFVNLGLHQRRAEQVWRMTHDFLHKKWNKVGELYGIGQYGEDAYRMFCLGDMNFRPCDRFLRIYRAWYKMNFSQRDGSFFKLSQNEDVSSSENSD